MRGSCPVVDQESCVGCGACLPSCPTEVFTSRGWDERQILAGLRGGADGVTLACARRADAEVAEAGALRVVVCLAALSPGVLFEAALGGEVGLLLDACPDCPLAAAPAITAAADCADAWLHAAGRPPLDRDRTVALRPPAAESSRGRWLGRSKAAQTSALAAEKPRVDRRRFLVGMLRNGASAYLDLVGIGASLTAAPDPATAQASKRKPEDLLPRWRRELSAVYPEQARDDRRPAIWPSLAVGGACTACGACERVCPTTALHTTLRDGRFELLFTPGSCVECGLCAEVCAPRVLALASAPAPDPFVAAAVFAAPARRCLRCGAPVIDGTENLCALCAPAGRPPDVVESARGALSRRSAGPV